MSSRKIIDIVFRLIAACALIYVVLGFFGVVPTNEITQVIVLAICIVILVTWRILDKKKAD